MSFRRRCPVCTKLFFHRNSLNLNRPNLTCSEECRKTQRTDRQKERRYKSRLKRLKLQHMEQVKTWHHAKKKGRAA